MNSKIALGGSCHWCTEAVFQSLLGVEKVDQGFVASTGENETFSEAVIVEFDTKLIPLKTLIEVHLHTHECTSNHSMRHKYRSAVYVFSENQKRDIEIILKNLQSQFKNPITTQALPFDSFKPSAKQFTNYYYSNPEKPFCESYINPKIKMLIEKYAAHLDHKKVNHLR